MGATVEGSDEAIVRAVTKELVRRGVAVTEPPACARVHAVLERRSELLSVRVQDAWGRASKRLVAKPENAATVIESWLRDDLSAPLLVAQPAAPLGADPVLDDEVPPAHAPLRVARPTASRGFSMSALADTAFGTDGSLWFGVNATGCVRLGVACAGIMARVSFDTGIQGASERFATNRTALDLLVGVDLPWSAGAFRLSPGIGMGAGFIHNVEPPDDDETESDTGGMRGNAHFTLALPFTDAFAIELGLHGDLWVFTSTDELPGGPFVAHPLLGLARASLGLRYEVP